MRVALLGYGLAGEAFHAPFIAATAGLELATIVTGNAERAAAAAQRYPEATITADAAQAWDADVVVVATPNRFHVSYAHEAIARGVPVIVDKPLATSLHEVEVLLADLDAAGAKLTVFQNRRWDGDFLTAKRLIDSGALGTVIRLTSRFIRFRPQIKDGWREGGDPRDGGGQLLDLGPLLIDPALLLLGPARSVYAEIG
ncbi:MAG: Gfo/Idh/MocA family oxidoreductase, partial [Solirubrobacteraceae bacterium]|nr:Gfo/Idh/MocA family oxidoreductase [Solirubrobacteraceae bacterium]